LEGGGGESGAVQVGARVLTIKGLEPAIIRNCRQFYHYTHILKTRSISSDMFEGVRGANAFRMDSSNLSLDTKLCACASFAFLVEISSLSVDYTLTYLLGLASPV
jgi:hypothetical protein